MWGAEAENQTNHRRNIDLLHWQKYATGREYADMSVGQDEALKSESKQSGRDTIT
jgi:hypothetical protein